ncbi:hypothetical protein KY312_01485, partial [Candidatus Woesearchaeota archaeon]|nr:hypothetical protein [Candidatus Woesearchaeota archaeon]
MAKNCLRALISAAILGLASRYAEADTIIANYGPGNQVKIQGEFLEEDKNGVRLKTKNGIVRIQKKYIKKWIKDDYKVENDVEEKDEFAEKVEKALAEIEEGKVGEYFSLEKIGQIRREKLDYNDLFKSKKTLEMLPELRIEDLRKITMCPGLTIKKYRGKVKISPGKQVETNRYSRLPGGLTSAVIKGNQFNVQLSKFESSESGHSIKHLTNEKINGIPFPKDLVLIPISN